MSLDECQQKHTHRQFRAWIRWLDEQWNVPSRSDYYAMQIARAVKRVLSKEPNKIQSNEFVVKFVTLKPEPRVVETEETIAKKKKVASAISKARWFPFLGIGRKK